MAIDLIEMSELVKKKIASINTITEKCSLEERVKVFGETLVDLTKLRNDVEEKLYKVRNAEREIELQILAFDEAISQLKRAISELEGAAL